MCAGPFFPDGLGRGDAVPNINDIVQVAEALEKSPVAVLRDRCVAVRNRNATCRRCKDACPVDAIEVMANEIHLDAGACMACGGCTVVCPTEALVSVKPLDADLSRDSAKACANNDGRAVFACARISSKHVADPERYAEVPCLARVDESMLLSLVSHGASDIALVDGTCSTCKYRDTVPLTDATVLYANELLAAHGSAVRVTRESGFPDDMLIEDAQGLFGSTRRGFLADTYGMAKETAMTAAKATIEQELGYRPDEPSIGERLRVGANGALPQLRVARHEVLINSMDAIGPAQVDTLESRRFASIEIDVDTCNACGMCAVFCPTGALKRDDADNPSAELKALEFSAADCVQCGLCADVCWKKALVMSPKVSTAQLFDFEPRVFDLASAKRLKTSPFGRA